MTRKALNVGIAGLGAVGLEVARRLEIGIPGLTLAAVAVRDQDKARRNLAGVGDRIPVVAAEALEYRRPLKAGKGVEQTFELVRQTSPALTGDRSLSGDIARLAQAP